MNFFREHKISIIIFAIAIIARLGLFFINLNSNDGDFIDTIRAADGYYEISKNLVEGHGYTDDVGPVYAPNALRPPAWILLIALIAGVFGSYVPVFICVLVLGSLIPVLATVLSRRLVSNKIATAVGIFMALEPTGILNSTWIASETFFTFILLVFSLFIFRYIDLEKTSSAVWAGVFLGIAILVKPTVQFLPFLIPIGFLILFWKKLSRAHLKHAVCFVVVSVLVIAPWGYRNYREFGAWGLSAQGPFNLYTVLVPTVLSIENGTTYQEETQLVSFPDGITGKDINTGNGKYYTQKALEIISQHKLAMLKSMGISVVTFFTHDGILTVLGYAGVSIPNFLDKPAISILFNDPLQLARHIISYMATPLVLVLIARVVWVIIAIAFFFGAWRYWRAGKMTAYAWYALAIVGYFALLTTANGLGMNARFRLPVHPFILASAFYGLSVLWRFIVVKWASNRHA